MKAITRTGASVGLAVSLAAMSLGPAWAGSPSWEGFYLGGDGGYGMGVASAKIPSSGAPFFGGGAFSLTNTDFVGSTGVSAGALAGYNHMIAPNWLIGIEGDINWSDIRNRDTLVNNRSRDEGILQLEQTSSFSARARFGYLLAPETLLYGTAGVAWSRFAFSAVDVEPGFFFASEADPHWFAGPQFGVGIETMFAPRWSARLEYLETLYGAGTFTSNGTFGSLGEPLIQVRPAVGVARLGVAYHFGPDSAPIAASTPVPVKALPMPPPAPAWTGFYIGGAVAAGAANAKVDVPTAPGNSANGAGIAGVLPTGMVGYNQRVAPQWVLGIEAEAAPGISTADFQVDWTAAVRGRAGFLLTPWTLLYGDAGFLTGGVRTTSLVSNLVTVPNVRVDALEVGGGVEAALNEHWAGRLDYQYALPGTINNIAVAAGGISMPIVVHAQIQYVRLGVVYMFDGR